jgi:ABC-type Fe3+ transport system permease subunit
VPIFVPVPLSFNSGSFFTFPLAGISTRWYEVVLGTARWRSAIGNSLLIAFGTTALATTLGTLTAIGLASDRFPGRRIVMPLLISPLIVPSSSPRSVPISSTPGSDWSAAMPASSWPTRCWRVLSWWSPSAPA